MNWENYDSSIQYAFSHKDLKCLNPIIWIIVWKVYAEYELSCVLKSNFLWTVSFLYKTSLSYNQYTYRDFLSSYSFIRDKVTCTSKELLCNLIETPASKKVLN